MYNYLFLSFVIFQWNSLPDHDKASPLFVLWPMYHTSIN